MNLLLLISLLLNAFGTIIAVAGAIYNALGYHKLAFFLWIVSNSTLLLLFVGVALDWWILNSGAWMQVLLYMIFCTTSTYGYYRCLKE